jgi:hypothetical protein
MSDSGTVKGAVKSLVSVNDLSSGRDEGTKRLMLQFCLEHATDRLALYMFELSKITRVVSKTNRWGVRGVPITPAACGRHPHMKDAIPRN